MTICSNVSTKHGQTLFFIFKIFMVKTNLNLSKRLQEKQKCSLNPIHDRLSLSVIYMAQGFSIYLLSALSQGFNLL